MVKLSTESPDKVGSDAAAPRYSATAMTCPECGTTMKRDDLRLPKKRAVSRVGAPVAPAPRLLTWSCDACGRWQPRRDP